MIPKTVGAQVALLSLRTLAAHVRTHTTHVIGDLLGAVCLAGSGINCAFQVHLQGANPGVRLAAQAVWLVGSAQPWRGGVR